MLNVAAVLLARLHNKLGCVPLASAACWLGNCSRRSSCLSRDDCSDTSFTAAAAAVAAAKN